LGSPVGSAGWLSGFSVGFRLGRSWGGISGHLDTLIKLDY
jgi:hypothetical protein